MHARARQCTVQKIGRGGNEGGEGKEEKEEEEEEEKEEDEEEDEEDEEEDKEDEEDEEDEEEEEDEAKRRGEGRGGEGRGGRGGGGGESVENLVRGDSFKAKAEAKPKQSKIHKTRRQAGGLFNYKLIWMVFQSGSSSFKIIGRYKTWIDMIFIKCCQKIKEIGQQPPQPCRLMNPLDETLLDTAGLQRRVAQLVEPRPFHGRCEVILITRKEHWLLWPFLYQRYQTSYNHLIPSGYSRKFCWSIAPRTDLEQWFLSYKVRWYAGW